MRKDRAAQQRLFSGTIVRGLTQPLNAYGYKYFYLLFFYPFVVPADLSQQAKSATADGLTYSDSIDKKLNLSTFCPLEKKLTDSNTFRRGIDSLKLPYFEKE
jgi:hypothetical protein